MWCGLREDENRSRGGEGSGLLECGQGNVRCRMEQYGAFVPYPHASLIVSYGHREEPTHEM